MAFWNSADLSQPPSNTCRINISMNEIHNLKLVFESAASIFSNLKPLHVEAAMASRVIYKLKSKFHSDVGFQKLEKVNRALLKYLAADFPFVYSQFTDLLPGYDQSGIETYMPTRQMLEWVLVRTQGFARLFCVIATTCEEASRFWMNRITIGQSWNVATLVMGIVGRIWAYAKYLVVTACDWYSQLKPYLDVLQPNGRGWKPVDYIFPEDLKLWLNVPHITKSNQSLPESDTRDVKSAFSLLEAGCDKDLRVRSSTSSGIQNVHIDLGETISRSELQLINSKKQKKKTKKLKMNALQSQQVKNVDNNINTKLSKKKKKKMVESHLRQVKDESSEINTKIMKKKRKNVHLEEKIKEGKKGNKLKMKEKMRLKKSKKQT